MIADFILPFEDTPEYRTLAQMHAAITRALASACDMAGLSEDAIQQALDDQRQQFEARAGLLRERYERGEE